MNRQQSKSEGKKEDWRRIILISMTDLSIIGRAGYHQSRGNMVEREIISIKDGRKGQLTDAITCLTEILSKRR